jgi:UDP-3-O-[3-hydroxymyristoyl] glucosamine N-acyltransferase
MASFTVEQLAEKVGGQVEGDPGHEISGVGVIGIAGPGQLTFLIDRQLEVRLEVCAPGAVLVSPSFDRKLPGTSLIRVPDPELAFANLVRLFHPQELTPEGIHETAVIHSSVKLGVAASVGPHVVIDRDTVIGERVRIGANAVIGAGVQIGDDCELGPACAVLRDSVLGCRVVLASGVRIGVDGFGYARGPDGAVKIPQVGRCRIEDDVEIGANSTIDCGAIGDTVIGRGTKIDNLVHIGHNVRIGEHCMIVAQVGLAGSVTVGDGVQFGGQAGASGHLEIGSGARIAGRAGVIGDVPAGATYSGYPARPHRQSLRSHAMLGKLPSIVRRIVALEDHVGLEEE